MNNTLIGNTNSPGTDLITEASYQNAQNIVRSWLGLRPYV